MTTAVRGIALLLITALLLGACSASASPSTQPAAELAGRIAAGDPASGSVVPSAGVSAAASGGPSAGSSSASSPAPSGAASTIGLHAFPAGATATVDDGTWALADRVRAATYTTDTTLAFDQALARAGIAVVADASTDPATAVPEVPVSGTPSPLELLDFQAHDLAVGTWAGAGWTGAELDQLVPLPAGQDGVPTLADLLAGYVASANTPGGAFSRALMGGQNLLDPATARFPTVVMALFASDVAADNGGAAGPSPSAGPSDAPSVTPSLEPSASPAAVKQSLAGVTQPHVEPAVDVGLICAGPSAWIDAIVAKLDEAIAAATPSSTIGGLIFGVVHWLVHIAVGLIKGIVDALIAPVLDAIKAFAAVATGLVQQIASILPFSVQVIAGHTQVAEGATFFLDNVTQDGLYTAYVTAGDLPDWPAVVKACAQGAGITLPDFASKDVPLTFGPLQAPGNPLIAPNGQTPTLTVTDDTGAATWSFDALTDPGDPTGEQENQFDWMPVAVHRPELDDLKAELTKTLLAHVPDIAKGFIASIFQPLLDGIQDRLNAILDARGTGAAIIVYHDKAPPTPAPSGAPSPSAAACTASLPAGTYQGQLSIKSTTIIPPGQIDLGEAAVTNEAGSGPMTVTVAPDGTLSGAFSLSQTQDQVFTGLAPGTSTTTIEEVGKDVTGTVCNLTLEFASSVITSCTSTGHGLCGGVGVELDLSSLVPPLPLGPPVSMAGGAFTWSISNETGYDAGFGGLSGEVASTVTATLAAP